MFAPRNRPSISTGLLLVMTRICRVRFFFLRLRYLLPEVGASSAVMRREVPAVLSELAAGP